MHPDDIDEYREPEYRCGLPDLAKAALGCALGFALFLLGAAAGIAIIVFH